MIIVNNQKKRKFVSFISLISVCLILFTINVFAWEPGSDPGGGSSHGNCNGSCDMATSSGFPYGYRIYLMDNNGNVLARSDAINTQGIDNLKIFSGNKIRKEVVGVGNRSLTAANYTPTNMFGKFMHVSSVADFDTVFAKSQNLIADKANPGSYCTSRNGTTCVDTSKEADKQYMLQKLQSFLTSVGITYKAEDLYNLWRSSTTKQNIYLAAEAIGTVRVGSNLFVAGTCTELIYYAWQDGYDKASCGGSTCQNGVLLELCGTATLTKFDGGGYYATSKDYSTSWQNYSKPIFTRIISNNKVNGNIEGISVFLWKISDLFGEKETCPVSVPENERCNAKNYKTANCCSCQKAAELEAKGVYIPDEVKKAYADDYYPVCEYKEPPKCPYTLDVKIPNTCTSDGNSGYVQDEASWKCTFTSANPDNDSTVRNNYRFSTFSNNYCAIYCQEKIEFDLPGSGAYTDAGTYLTLSAHSGYQTLGPIRYKGTSTCRSTTSVGSEAGAINLSKFYTDFAAADHAVLVAYDNWQYAELQNEVINNATSHHWSQTCTDSWCTSYKNKTTCTGTGTKKTCTTSTYCASTDHCSASRSGTYYTYNNKTFYGATFTSGTGISDGGCGCTSRCGSSCTAKASLKDVASLKQAYINAVNSRTAVLEELKKCNNFYRTYIEFKPSVSFYYEDDLYEKTYDLKASGTASSVTNYFMSGNATGAANSSTITKINSVTNDSTDSGTYYAESSAVNGNSSTIAYYNCGFGVTKTKCTAIGYYQYPTNKWFEQITTRTYSYSLPNNINQYVNKPSGQSTNTPTSENYDYIPFSNLPVHYSTKVGTYKYSITTTSFGNNNKFNKYIIGNSAFNKVSYTKNTKYECTYKVACDKTIICGKNSCDNSCGDDDDDSGTDLIYRPISLYYPFPGQNATSTNVRESGENWKTYYGINVVSNFIYNNRGVSYYEIYKLQPMYEITLTPALMRKIKNYNDQQNSKTEIYYVGTKKQITASSGYSDFTLKCKTNSDGSKAQNCTSAIIRSWGVKGCAISGSGYTKCGNTVAW